MAAKVTIIIVNFNGGPLLKRCVECVLAQNFTDFDVIIVDNASTDNSLSLIPEDSRLNTIKLDTNIGFAAANNLAARKTLSPWIACLNPDAFPTKEWLQQCMYATLRFPGIPAFGSTQIRANEPSILDGAGDVYHFSGIPYRGHYGLSLSKLPPTGETFSPCAAAALYQREIFLNLNGFDEHFFCYGEDVDLGFRLRLKGYRCIQLKEAVVYHAASSLSGLRSDFQIYHGVRNRIWVWVKNMPLALIPISLPLLIFMHVVLLGKAILHNESRPMLRGITDAFKMMRPILVQRKTIQSTSNTSPLALAKAFTWSMLKLSRREADIRPYSPKQTYTNSNKPKV